jgi:release factor glutamine methyltransferase
VLRICDILSITEEALKNKGIENARLNAELLLGLVLKVERIELFLNFEKPLTDAEISAYRELVRRRLNHEPLQYILGWWEFYGIQFRITPAVLIPRPETETLVEESIKVISELKKPKVLEIGTGSGCVSIAIARNTNCDIIAADTSGEAIDIALYNSGRAGAAEKILFKLRDIFSDFEDFNEYDVVLSNPPYIDADEFDSLPEEIRLYEPKNALTDGKDGLSYYRRTAELARKTESDVICLAEIGDGKKEKVENALEEYGMKNIEFVRDLMGIARVVKFVNRL